MKHYQTDNGECLEYKDVNKFLQIFFCTFGLDRVAAEQCIDIALTLDGPTLAKHLKLLISGIK